jgi:hypothetical protein
MSPRSNVFNGSSASSAWSARPAIRARLRRHPRSPRTDAPYASVDERDRDGEPAAPGIREPAAPGIREPAAPRIREPAPPEWVQVKRLRRNRAEGAFTSPGEARSPSPKVHDLRPKARPPFPGAARPPFPGAARPPSRSRRRRGVHVTLSGQGDLVRHVSFCNRSASWQPPETRRAPKFPSRLRRPFGCAGSFRGDSRGGPIKNPIPEMRKAGP